jgi:hypothetical protein
MGLVNVLLYVGIVVLLIVVRVVSAGQIIAGGKGGSSTKGVTKKVSL